MKNLDFKGMTNDELVENYINFKNDLFGLKFQLSIAQLADTNKIEQAKRNIARALTEMNARGMDSNKIKMPVVKKEVSKKAKKQKAKQDAKKEAKKEAKEAKKVDKKTEAKKATKTAEPKKTVKAPAPAPAMVAGLAKTTAKAKAPTSKAAAPKVKKDGK